MCTLLLVIAGGLVTSNDAALSVPDWPLSWGRLVPPLEGGIVYEFTHRVLAAAVGILSIILAVWLQKAEKRAWMRRLGWLAVGAVLAQAVLGGAQVRLVTPKLLTIAHASLAQLVFGVMAAIVVGQLCGLPGGRWVVRNPAPLVAAAGLFAQTILGAAVRHGAVGLVPHLAGAGVATLLAMWAGLGVLIHHMEETGLRRASMGLLSLTFSQVFLGMGAYMSRMATADAPQPMPLMVGFTVAHVAVGSLAFGAAVALALLVYGQARPAEVELAHGGVAIA